MRLGLSPCQTPGALSPKQSCDFPMKPGSPGGQPSLRLAAAGRQGGMQAAAAVVLESVHPTPYTALKTDPQAKSNFV